jgi:hypothetical protein
MRREKRAKGAEREEGKKRSREVDEEEERSMATK